MIKTQSVVVFLSKGGGRQCHDFVVRGEKERVVISRVLPESVQHFFLMERIYPRLLFLRH